MSSRSSCSAHLNASLPCCTAHVITLPLPPHPPPPCSAVDALTCPAGSYCPTPAVVHPCPPGYFCPSATVQPVTCNVTLLTAAAPGMLVPDPPFTVAQRVFFLGDPLQGNTCPARASSPSTLCPGG